MRKIREVLRRDAAGLSNRRIAASLNIGAASAEDYPRRRGTPVWAGGCPTV